MFPGRTGAKAANATRGCAQKQDDKSSDQTGFNDK